ELTTLLKLGFGFSEFAQHKYLQSTACMHSLKLTSNRHLVFPNGRTYDLYDARPVPWNPDQ
ncbi:hypothetical protein HPB47_015818, partial [Ixodes persulcatus]